jgi:hypothetical protein
VAKKAVQEGNPEQLQIIPQGHKFLVFDAALFAKP